MTDEEKAEEYAEDYKTKDGRSLDYCDIKKAHLDGLTKGRNEGYKQGKETLLEMNEVLDSIDAKTQIKELEKENVKLNRDKTELVNSVTELENKVTELEKENEKLKEQNKIILEDNDTLNKWIDELNEQIEKMKNCQNCKHDRYRICISEIRCENLEQWELAE